VFRSGFVGLVSIADRDLAFQDFWPRFGSGHAAGLYGARWGARRAALRAHLGRRLGLYGARWGARRAALRAHRRMRLGCLLRALREGQKDSEI
jgi:hypothetical protein